MKPLDAAVIKKIISHILSLFNTMISNKHPSPVWAKSLYISNKLIISVQKKRTLKIYIVNIFAED